MNELLRRLLFLPPQASSVARDVDSLHYFVILTTMAGATLVTLVGGFYLAKYRRNRHPDSLRPTAAAIPFWLEATVVVGLFGLFLLWWFIGARLFMRMRVAPEDSMEVYVTAKQWMWRFNYPEGTRSIAALYVPVNRPVKLVMSSRDVIHSFYVPDFRIKQDVVPGRTTTVWFQATSAGTHPILCAEYCGTAHSTMRGEVVVLEPADFDRWLAGEQVRPEIGPQPYEAPAVVGQFAPAEPLGLARLGEYAAARQGCLRCHTTDGTPHIGPTWAGLYRSTVPLAGGGQVIADEAFITESMMDPASKRHDGYALVMPSYLGLVDPGDTAAIIEFIKSLRLVPKGPPGPAPALPEAPGPARTAPGGGAP